LLELYCWHLARQKTALVKQAVLLSAVRVTLGGGSAGNFILLRGKEPSACLLPAQILAGAAWC